jgi:DNA-binding CsgD family transcriptional regulator/PAS domain-containing protein
MVASDSLSSLIGLIYEAAQHHEAWDIFLEQLAALTTSTQVVLFVHDARLHEYGFVHQLGVSPESQQLYAQYYAEKDEWVKRARGQLRPGVVVASHILCSDQELTKTEFFNDYLAKSGVFYQFGGCIHRDEARMALISLLRPRKSGPYGESHRKLLRLLIPHLQRATDIHKNLVDLRRRAGGLATTIEHLSCGILLLDENARVVILNAAARTILTGDNGLRISGDRLGAVSLRDHDRLTEIIHGALASRGGGQIGGAMTLARSRGHSLTLTVFPIRLEGLDTCVTAAVFISDPDLFPRIDLGNFARMYGLTPAERRLVMLLLKGKMLSDAAELVGVSIHTVRSQVKSILHKTGASRQSELVKLLLSSGLPLSNS